MALICLPSFSQKVWPIYKGLPPYAIVADSSTEKQTFDGILRVSQVSLPTITGFFPKQPNGTSIVIFPGGGYKILAFSHEGTEVAQWLTTLGITAFVVKYRLPDSTYMTAKEKVPLTDALEAIALIRSKAEEWHLNPQKIGVLGFSAGGHLAAAASTHFIDFEGGIYTKKSKPNFSILVYPVIKSGKDGHMGSMTNLLGSQPTAAQMEWFSNELNVSEQTPPAILLHTATDGTVSVGNSVAYTEALWKKGIKASLHVYQDGPHGFGMKPTDKTISYANWLMDVQQWLLSMGFL